MGMSHDFEIAVQEGATIVRLGTAIFGSVTLSASVARRTCAPVFPLEIVFIAGYRT